eukprot:364333-Chlamydomonas_euryale.AAC.1
MSLKVEQQHVALLLEDCVAQRVWTCWGFAWNGCFAGCSLRFVRRPPNTSLHDIGCPYLNPGPKCWRPITVQHPRPQSPPPSPIISSPVCCLANSCPVPLPPFPLPTQPAAAFCSDSRIAMKLADGSTLTLPPPSFVAAALELLVLTPGTSFLDAGCGTGYVTALAAAM